MMMLIMMEAIRKGTNGVSTNGVTANLISFDRGTFWVLPLTYFYLPKSARAYLFPQSARNKHYFCSGPICPHLLTAEEANDNDNDKSDNVKKS